MDCKSDYKSFARSLRKNQTLGETILWTRILSKRQMKGYLFNRQYCISDYIVDFICRKLRLVIEIDGYSHDFKIEKDRERNIKLTALGYIVLRLLERDVRDNLEGVYIEISRVIDELNTKSQSP